jgi:hypothetical protein
MPESHPALLTVGGDGVLRFWVEVTLRPLLGSDGCGQARIADTFRHAHACMKEAEHPASSHTAHRKRMRGSPHICLLPCYALQTPSRQRCCCTPNTDSATLHVQTLSDSTSRFACCRALPLDSHFCCTLVIEPPPGASLTPLMEGQLQACWGTPDQSHLPGGLPVHRDCSAVQQRHAYGSC